MPDVPLDAQERVELCSSFEELGPGVPTLLDGWTAHDLAAHLVQREHDLLGGPCLVLPGPFARFAERRRARSAGRSDFAGLVAQIRSGPPVGFFRIRWVRDMANLNESFVHHEDLRRSNGLDVRSLTPAMDAGLWRNVRRAGRFLSRRLRGCGLEVEWAGTSERVLVRPGSPTALLSGPPGELLLYLFGRQGAAKVEVSGPAEAVAAVGRAHFGM
ncbi:TIGR03085 family protein [Mycobacterium sp. 852002-50816_SCH5313054-b]|uniref:TIGR03085 family metal-binding protein n=1 Tax=Mycobacterium sp. 852002-50816_SCH5313054-b TaxID=1834092 RepID=UPI0007FBBF33|nr:TIGR03085 family metal-binding protein [Mycobacterium sp. 852002-50816_SCH5313054-b]OBF63651.1 TIGR03085 family protein [Mycobacterium sp. 852002-50816_SCH5313054-b]